MAAATAVPAITYVGCDLHRNPEPYDCTRCHDAMEITLRLAHEQGECGGEKWCDFCAMKKARP